MQPKLAVELVQCQQLPQYPFRFQTITTIPLHFSNNYHNTPVEVFFLVQPKLADAMAMYQQNANPKATHRGTLLQE